jgi:hypothetical protein
MGREPHCIASRNFILTAKAEAARAAALAPQKTKRIVLLRKAAAKQESAAKLYVAVDQSIDARLLFLRESAGEQGDSTKGAGLSGNSGLCFIKIVPHLDCDEANQQREKNA